jgi:hypothetical protein
VLLALEPTDAGDADRVVQRYGAAVSATCFQVDSEMFKFLQGRLPASLQLRVALRCG